ncbi:MAG: prepilin-type N-terminal cleavage/methylation domain-containing protein [Hahellaceae bacterium]|nr:prepilin-type N-terminal cleavage/methylation domain-containing protein [Hahellaceae bacterium]
MRMPAHNPSLFKQAARLTRGFTLIELVVTIVILGIGVAGLASLMSQAMVRGTDAIVHTRLVSVGRAYLKEVQGKPYAEGGATSTCSIQQEEGNRMAFDDVDDYNGLNEKPPRTQISTAINQYAGIRVSVSVACAGTELGLSSGNLKRITVTVRDDSGPLQVFVAYRGPHA